MLGIEIDFVRASGSKACLALLPAIEMDLPNWCQKKKFGVTRKATYQQGGPNRTFRAGRQHLKRQLDLPLDRVCFAAMLAFHPD